MRVYLTFPRVALALIGLWLAIGVPAGAFATEPSESPQVVIAEPSTPANLLNYTEYYEAADTKAPAVKDAAPSTEVSTGPGCGCDSCGCSCGHWIAGVEAAWLSPQQQANPYAAYTIYNSTPAIINSYRGVDVSGFFLSPRIWLGYQGECWGGQIRYWRLSEPKSEFLPGSQQSYNGVFYNSTFKAETLDLEATRLFCWRDTTNVFSFGIRYAQLDESQAVTVTQQFNGGNTVFNGRSYARNELSGAGLTAALTGYMPLQNRNFNLFYSVRGSFIWDDKAINQVEARADYADLISSDTALAGSRVCSNGDMFIGEFQVGAQWNFQLACNRADAFIRVALEYQYWDTNNTGYNAAYATVNNADYLGLSYVASGDTRADLVGVTVGTGFTW